MSCTSTTMTRHRHSFRCTLSRMRCLIISAISKRSRSGPSKRRGSMMCSHPGDVDFLKLDVQGAELMVLRSAQRTLERTAVVHCEVEFSPIYEGQPLYPEIQVFLNQHGFELIDLLVPARYHYIQPETAPAHDRLIWADAVFFHTTDDPDTLRAQSVIAAAVYSKPTLAAHLMFCASDRSRP